MVCRCRLSERCLYLTPRDKLCTKPRSLYTWRTFGEQNGKINGKAGGYSVCACAYQVQGRSRSDRRKVTCAAAPLWTTTESRFGVVHQPEHHGRQLEGHPSPRQEVTFSHLNNAAVSVQALAQLVTARSPATTEVRSRGQHGRSDLADKARVPALEIVSDTGRTHLRALLYYRESKGCVCQLRVNCFWQQGG